MGGSPQGTGTDAPLQSPQGTGTYAPATALPCLRPLCLGLRCSARNRPIRSHRTQLPRTKPPHPQSPHAAAPLARNLPSLFLHTTCLDALYSGACPSTWRGAEGKCRSGFPQEQQRSSGEARKENSKTPGTVRAQSASFPGVSIVFERVSVNHCDEDLAKAQPTGPVTQKKEYNIQVILTQISRSHPPPHPHGWSARYMTRSS